MFPIVLAIVALTAASQPVAAADLNAPSARPDAVAAADVETSASPLPGAPRSVRVTPTSEGHVVTWRQPASSGASQLTGYVVIADDEPILVDAATRRVVLTAAPARIAVAALNETGSSLASYPAGLAQGTVARQVAPAPRLGR